MLGQFDINYRPRIAIKSQALVDFIAEFTYYNTIEVFGIADNAKAMKGVEMKRDEVSANRQEDSNLGGEQWVLYMDGASNENRLGAGIMLISLKGQKIHYALHFGFQASNNEAEYETLIVGLKVAKELNVDNLKVYNDS